MGLEGVGERLGSAPRDMLQALLEAVADAVYVVDPEGRVEFANPAALRLLGYEEDELLGRVSHPTIHHSHWDGTHFPQDECPMLRPRLTGETVRVYGDCFWRKDGSKFRVAYSSAPLAMRDGRGAVVVFRDVTSRIDDEHAARREAVERARAQEIHASRARIVAAADAERRRLGRDLHDGAQQRLVRILLALRLAGRKADPDIPEQRYPPNLEAAAYFVIAEGLTNTLKHARATAAAVTVSERDSTLVIEVADDGRGGVDIASGSGLRGLEDRVAALDGTFEVADGQVGTRIKATLPL
jgi:PAS domain S-box-containing protein